MEEQRYIATETTDGNYKWRVKDTLENKNVAFSGSRVTADGWARQLNEKGYIEDEF